MPSRGTYRGVFSSLVDDLDFQQLSPEARLAFHTVRICSQIGPAGIFRYYLGPLSEQSGLSERKVEKALKELEQTKPGEPFGWIVREGGILWVVNALRHDPTMRLGDKKHQACVVKAISGLPHMQIVITFCDYYKIPRPFEGPSMTLREKSRVGSPNPNPNPKKTESESESDTTTTSFAPLGQTSWPSPESLQELFNASVPDAVPKAETLGDDRRKKARDALRQFPARTWWEETFAEYHASRFLCGLERSEDHKNFQPDFDWLLSRGKANQVLNAVKVHDGKYRDQPRAPDVPKGTKQTMQAVAQFLGKPEDKPW